MKNYVITINIPKDGACNTVAIMKSSRSIIVQHKHKQ